MANKAYIVTGAPSAGKTSTIDELLKLDNQGAVILDIDWLMKPASQLAGKDVVTHQETWKPFRQLWSDLIGKLLANHLDVVFFANINKQDVAALNSAPLSQATWLLLDCSDEVRRARHTGRYGSEEGIEDNLEDARKLRAEVSTVIHTGELSPAQVAAKVQEWFSTGGSYEI